MYNSDFQKRILYQGDPSILLKKVAIDYKLGDYCSHSNVSVGYEDFNVILKTTTGLYFVKCLSTFRSDEDCQRYINIMLAVLEAGISHPKLYKSGQGYLYQSILDGQKTSLCVLEYIEGESFYHHKQQPTVEELTFLMKQAALIGQIDIRPPPIYDSWACVNFINEYRQKKQYLSASDLLLIEPIAKDFIKYDLKKLPHCLVHGDIIRTNTMRSKSGQIYVYDFSVANWDPRIQELAVLFCDLFFNQSNPSTFLDLYNKGLVEYQNISPLTSSEVCLLPLFTKVAHAMHLLNGTFEYKINGNNSKENDFWIQLGRSGLEYCQSVWK